MTRPQEAGLEGLHDIVVPEPVSWTPQTLGWAVLGVLVAAGLVVVAVHLVRRHRANAYRREAEAELDGIERRLHDPDDRVRALEEVPVLLKRTTLSVAPRAEVASLSGSAWLDFLDGTLGGSEFTTGPGRVLPSLAYGPGRDESPLSPADVESLMRLVRRWIRRHRV